MEDPEETFLFLVCFLLFPSSHLHLQSYVMITCTCGFSTIFIGILAKTFLSRKDCWGFEDGKLSPNNEKTCGQLPTLSSLPLHPSNSAREVQLNSCQPFKVAQNKQHHSYLL